MMLAEAKQELPKGEEMSQEQSITLSDELLGQLPSLAQFTDEEIASVWDTDSELDKLEESDEISKVYDIYFKGNECLTPTQMRCCLDIHEDVQTLMSSLPSLSPGGSSDGREGSPSNLTQIDVVGKQSGSSEVEGDSPLVAQASCEGCQQAAPDESFLYEGQSVFGDSCFSVVATLTQSQIENSYDKLVRKFNQEPEIDYVAEDPDYNLTSSQIRDYVGRLFPYWGTFSLENIPKARDMEEFIQKVEKSQRGDEKLKHLLKLVDDELCKLKRRAACHEVKFLWDKQEKEGNKKPEEKNIPRLVTEGTPPIEITKAEQDEMLIELLETSLKSNLEIVEHLHSRIQKSNTDSQSQGDNIEEYVNGQSKDVLLIKKCMAVEPEVRKRQTFFQYLIKVLGLAHEEHKSPGMIKKLVNALKKPKAVPNFQEQHQALLYKEKSRFFRRRRKLPVLKNPQHRFVEATPSNDTLAGTEEIMEDSRESGPGLRVPSSLKFTNEPAATKQIVCVSVHTGDDTPKTESFECDQVSQEKPIGLSDVLPERPVDIPGFEFIDESSCKMDTQVSVAEGQEVALTHDDLEHMTLHPETGQEKRVLSPHTPEKVFASTKKTKPQTNDEL